MSDQTDSKRNYAVTKRLDALIRLLIETNKANQTKINEAEAARILESVGLTPTEIAKILGKKSRTDVSSYLYGKKKKTQNATQKPNENKG